MRGANRDEFLAAYMGKGKPDNMNLPSWVCWVACDADGCWWGYEAEPNQSHNGWYENEVGRSLKIRRDPPDPDWQVSLRKIKQG